MAPVVGTFFKREILNSLSFFIPYFLITVFLIVEYYCYFCFNKFYL